MPQVVVAESAVGDMEALLAWYTEQGARDVGDRLLGNILEQIESLADHPELGRMVPEFGQPHLRELIQPPFRIVYRFDSTHLSDEVQIVRVWRSERRLKLDQA